MHTRRAVRLASCGSMLPGEHILLESDERQIPDLRTSHKIFASAAVRSRLRGRAIRLEIIEYYYLAVRLYRGTVLQREYVLDLRFVDRRVQLTRHIAWRWLLGTLGLATAAAVLGWRASTTASPRYWILACAATVLLALIAGFIAAWRT